MTIKIISYITITIIFLSVAFFVLKIYRHESPLTENGNDAFGTIQEAIQALNDKKDLDWSKVKIETLRQHLQDMNNMTLNVEILSQENVENGARVIVKPHNAEVRASLERVLAAHPPQMKRETGWTMNIIQEKDFFTIETTTQVISETEKVRALGYIGWMALGNHHQHHHWALINGENPHH